MVKLSLVNFIKMFFIEKGVVLYTTPFSIKNVFMKLTTFLTSKIKAVYAKPLIVDGNTLKIEVMSPWTFF